MTTTSRTARICCLDLDTFFVSVERLHRPDLIGKPVVVGALPGSRGVVTAASYEVRAFGVHSGMPIAEAYRLAPNAIYLSGRHGEYGEYARKVKTILERCLGYAEVPPGDHRDGTVRKGSLIRDEAEGGRATTLRLRRNQAR